MVLTLAACGGRSASTVSPSDPEATLRLFMNAVRERSLTTMSELWGGERGPAATYMPADELDKRLTLIRIYLEHETFEIVGTNFARSESGRGRVKLRVRLSRQGCEPVVPFTLQRYGSGWLISDIDLAAVGNPQRSCQ